ncbi:TadE/TadG family type IV pilus assembly protein [Alsobacter soli]|uniref:TadE/TadG family type IV pilus assembly protein n=1 Tax=Alsobacter soli TaxID=2109933 RepID=UPI001304B89F|nr:TadE family protein [Alsobacter soli]
MSGARVGLLRDERGAVAVEAALVLPLVIAFAFAIFEFGRIFYDYELAQTGVRDAARFLARMPDPHAAEAQAKALAVTGSPTGSGPARVAGWTVGQVSVTYETTPNPPDPSTGLRAFRGADPLTVVRVSTRIPHPGFGLLGVLGLGPVTLATNHAERSIGG